MQAVERSLSRTLAQRQIRKAQIRARDRLPLEHRGAWRLPDVGAHAPVFPPAEASTESLGAWGYYAMKHG
jgi:hypothetical protein